MATHENKAAATAFTKQSFDFDKQYRQSVIVQYMRPRVYTLLRKYLEEKSRILELNSGTAEDAIWLAKHGHRVLATDVSAGMIAQQRKKVDEQNLTDKIESRELSFLDLNRLEDQNFDAVFSNFGGLNCTDKLNVVLRDAAKKVKPGGIFCLVIMPPNCLWEWLSALKGNFKLAFRRWKKGGTTAHIEGEYFTTHYYKPSYIKTCLPGFTHITTEALCLAVPPEYLRHHMERFPRIFQFLKWKENRIKSWPVLRNWGDYFIMVLRAPRKS